MLAERDSGHSDGVAPIVLPRATGRTALGRCEARSDVEDDLSGVLEPSGKRNFYTLMLLTLASGRPVLGVITGLSFGLGRALPVVVAALTAADVAPRQPADSMFEWVQRHAGLVRFLAASTSFVGAWALGAGYVMGK